MLGAAMEAEIREQPALLRTNGPRYAAGLSALLSGRTFSLVLLAARGSSDNAALYARYLFEIALGVPVVLAAPSVLTRYGVRVRYPDCLAIGLSQSGAAPDVAEVLAAMRADGHATLAITNTPDSHLARVAEASLLLECGVESSVAATKTYTASLLALYEAARALGAELPDSADALPDDSWNLECGRRAADSAGGILRSNILFALGRGYAFGTAFETALKLMECALLPCKPFSTADFQHGPRALAGHGSAAIVYGEAPTGLADQGCLVLQAPAPPVPEPLQPIWHAMFGQWAALHAARARGLDPDDPRFLAKVTKTL